MLKPALFLGSVIFSSYLGFLGGKSSVKPQIFNDKPKTRAILYFMKDNQSLWPISPDKEKSFVLENAHKIKHRLECY